MLFELMPYPWFKRLPDVVHEMDDRLNSWALQQTVEHERPLVLKVAYQATGWLVARLALIAALAAVGAALLS